jgi:hypothetical protein
VSAMAQNWRWGSMKSNPPDRIAGLAAKQIR